MVGIPAEEREAVAALAGPFVHAALDVGGAADFQADLDVGVAVGGGGVAGCEIGEVVAVTGEFAVLWRRGRCGWG